MTVVRPLVLGAMLACLAACKSGPQTLPLPECRGPAWTCFKSGVCPFEAYKESLCAVGTADEIASYNLGIQAASTRARVEMASVVRSQLDAFHRSVQDSKSKKGAGEDSIQKVADVAQNVVEASMSGVTVPRTFYDPDEKVYFALAVVDAPTFVNAMKALRDAKGLSDALRAEIDERAADVVEEWRAEQSRKKQQR